MKNKKTQKSSELNEEWNTTEYIIDITNILATEPEFKS